MPTLLICKCGDCNHWEIIHKENGDAVIKCVTCSVEYKAQVSVDPHEDLHYMPHEA